MVRRLQCVGTSLIVLSLLFVALSLRITAQPADPCKVPKDSVAAYQQKLSSLLLNQPQQNPGETEEQLKNRMKDFETLKAKWEAGLASWKAKLDSCKKATAAKKSGSVAPKAVPPAGGAFKPAPTVTISLDCRDGAERNPSKETKSFEYTTEATAAVLSIADPKERAYRSADEFAEYLKKGLKLKDILEHVGIKIDPTGGLLTKPVEIGADVMKGLAGWKSIPLRDFQVCYVIRPTVKKDATCSSKEVCEKGKWVPKKEFSEVVGEAGAITECFTVAALDIANDSMNAVDFGKLKDKALELLNAKLKELADSKKAYEDFKKACK